MTQRIQVNFGEGILPPTPTETLSAIIARLSDKLAEASRTVNVPPGGRVEITSDGVLVFDDVSAAAPLVDDVPLTSWRAIAEVLGVSVSTLLRRRSNRGDTSPAYFSTAEAARQWYAELTAPRKKAKRTSVAARPTQEGASEADVSKALAALKRRPT